MIDSRIKRLEEKYSVKIAAIVCTREQSDRIRFKPLQKLYKGVSAHGIILYRFSFVNLISACSSCSQIAINIARSRGVHVFVGHDASPLHRMSAAADKYNVDVIIRVTNDDVLIDKEIIIKQLEYHLKSKNDYTYQGRTPEGTGAEIINASAIKDLAENLGHECEYISYHLKTGKYKYSEFYPPKEYCSDIVVSLDYPNDVDVLRTVIENIGYNCGILDIIHFSKKNPAIFEINRRPEVSFYTCVHNMADTIIECIDSVIACMVEFERSEYIIINDASTDNTIDVVMKYLSKLPSHMRDRIRVYSNDVNTGLEASSSLAIDKSSGDYIMRVDADDYISNYSIITYMQGKMRLDSTKGCQSAYMRDGEAVDSHDHTGCALFEKRLVNEYRFKYNIKFAKGTEFLEKYRKDFGVSTMSDPLWYYRPKKKQS